MGCGIGVCWGCMAAAPRATLGDVRTTKDEFRALAGEGQAWWMHEACMEKGDAAEYFGGHKEYAQAKQAAAEEEARRVEWQQQQWAQLQAAHAAAQAVEAEKAQLVIMSIEQLRQYLGLKGLPTMDVPDRDGLLGRALGHLAQNPPPLPTGPAWLPPGGKCKTCSKVFKQELCGVLCKRTRANGTSGGCGGGACWRCMKRASRDEFGGVRCTQEEFEALGIKAWWMHERCMTPQDRQDYYAEE